MILNISFLNLPKMKNKKKTKQISKLKIFNRMNAKIEIQSAFGKSIMPIKKMTDILCKNNQKRKKLRAKKGNILLILLVLIKMLLIKKEIRSKKN
jgi:hypothetical protein